ncbi:MAG: glycosyltransferase family 2 protein [Magnetococcales bacterium]|nr:glycosyltransferase family 2 protein [Magnetococcales bacterium]
MLDLITPVILTRNEAPNIGRTLERLWWAKRVVVLDSYSTDATRDIADAFPNVDFHQRAFDAHARQWNVAIHEIVFQENAWILALDADYQVSEELVQEMAKLRPDAGIVGYVARFRYCIGGRPLRGTLYPDKVVLFRRAHGRYIQDGHTQALTIEGRLGILRNPIDHDDRKPLSHWLGAQDHYMRLEADHLLTTPWGMLSWPDRLRRLYLVVPLLAFVHCLIFKRGFLDGRAGWYYACQRTLSELLLSLRLLERRLALDAEPPDALPHQRPPTRA